MSLKSILKLQEETLLVIGGLPGHFASFPFLIWSAPFGSIIFLLWYRPEVRGGKEGKLT